MSTFLKKQLNSLKKGAYFMIDEEPCQILDTEHSKSGKHGHAKCRVTAVGLFTKKKKVYSSPADSMVDTPEIIKGSAQITDITETKILAMDKETMESIELDVPDAEFEPDVVEKAKTLLADKTKCERATVEYWTVAGSKIVRRIGID